ncbi:hypothetical protein V8D89_012542 [Ganoderma adspersum]
MYGRDIPRISTWNGTEQTEVAQDNGLLDQPHGNRSSTSATSHFSTTQARIRRRYTARARIRPSVSTGKYRSSAESATARAKNSQPNNGPPPTSFKL